MSIDTQEQALAEARKRWGMGAQVGNLCPGKPLGWVWVDSNYLSYKPSIQGMGDSWDAAFADADKREGK